MPNSERRFSREQACAPTEFQQVKLADIDALLAERMAVSVISDRRELRRLKHCLLDWFATALVGEASPTLRVAQQTLLTPNASGHSSVIGSERKTNPREAAWLNACAAHAMEFDSSTPTAGAHLVTPVVAACMALAEPYERSGVELLQAIGRGLDVGHIVGVATFNPDSATPLHFTGYTGALAAAAGAGSIVGLDPIGLLKSISLAASQAGGLKAMFGTMGKHLNAANPAAAGVLSAQLVANGFSAPVTGVTGRQGFAAAFGASSVASPRRADADIAVSGAAATVFKYHACCHGSHSAIEAIRKLRDKEQFLADQVAALRLYVPSGVARLCPVTAPGNGLQSQFCLPYIAALALAGDATDIEAFSDERVAKKEHAALLKLVQVNTDCAVADVTAPTRVELTLRDGRQIAASGPRLEPVGVTELNRQERRLNKKLVPIADKALGPERCAMLLDLLAGVEALPSVRPLADLLREVCP